MSAVSTEQLRSEIVTWLAKQIDSVRSRRFESNAQPTGNARMKQKVGEAGRKAVEAGEKFVDAIVRRVSANGQGQRPIEVQPADLEKAKQIARSRHEAALDSLSLLGNLESPAALVEELCRSLKVPIAVSAALAWFDETALEEGDTIVDTEDLVSIIGAVAAVVVAVVVFLVRRGRWVEGRGLRLEASEDFALILEVAKGTGATAEAARTLQAEAAEPWRWDLSQGVAELEEASRRDLLLGLVGLPGSPVRTVEPVPGARFEPRTMCAPADLDQDSIWVVTKMLKPGFAAGGRTVERARVEVVTLDSSVLLDGTCPVGRYLTEHADDLLPGGRDGAAVWRAPWGLSHPEDLRDRFDEALLDAWRTRLINELNEAYSGKAERQLALTGRAGAVFEGSTMDVEGVAPAGDATVEDLVPRDGVPQHGLACPGGSPLLLAVVSVRPLEAA